MKYILFLFSASFLYCLFAIGQGNKPCYPMMPREFCPPERQSNYVGYISFGGKFQRTGQMLIFR